MLTKFQVKNFKNFSDNFIFDLSSTKNYAFNPECVKNNVINKSIIQGPNGIGKSNLGFAIYDISTHLSDKKPVSAEFYENYLNAETGIDIAEFIYNFKFDENIVEYSYGKKSPEEVVYEELKINGKAVVSYNRRREVSATIDLKGAETLNKDLSHSKISIVKYIASSTVLLDDKTNKVFKEFFNFVDKMIFSRAVWGNTSLGPDGGSRIISNDILKRNNLKEFEEFLNNAGVVCKIKAVEQNGEDVIAFDFGKKSIEFFKIASMGTRSLSLFYFWLQRFKIPRESSLLFIDEFDAYYHHQLSKFIVNELKNSPCQVILTTHNTSIMTNDLLRPDCYFLMSKDKIRPIYEFTDKELREAHNIEKMYRAGAFDD